MTQPPVATAVILYGVLPRSLKHTHASLREFVLAPLAVQGPVDLFYHSWELDALVNPRAQEKQASLDMREIARFLPDAQGETEPQAIFDHSQDWEPLMARNPLRSSCDSEEAARFALMNLVRALHSLERAWLVFERLRVRNYARVVITRPDLLFVLPLPLPDLLARPAQLWVPNFQHWGGINDRFALGNPDGAEIYCRRLQFAQQWLLEHHTGNPERLLKAWLAQQAVQVQTLDFPCLRIRANGQMPDFDKRFFLNLHLSGRLNHLAGRYQLTQKSFAPPGPAQAAAAATVSARPAEVPARSRFLILTRRAETAAHNLQALLSPLGHCELIVDHPEAPGLWIPNHQLAGFEGLMGGTHFPLLTAWSRALYHAAQTLAEDELIWFVEEDVAGDAASFQALVHTTSRLRPDLAALRIYSRRQLPQWYWWPINRHWFARPWKSFNPLCALSPALIRHILALQAEKQRLTFHELLFASVAMQAGLKVLAWDRQPHLATCFGHFCWRPVITECTPGISHPVKDAALHSRISAL